MSESFFLLRPYWLLMLLPIVVLIFFFSRRSRAAGNSAWHKLVDAHLLKHLAISENARTNHRWYITALGTALITAVVALAGPTWEKIEIPSYSAHEPGVLVLSLAQSMNATDVSPSRLVRAGHKIRDILEKTKGGDLGLVIYADRPFVAVPLTNDSRVISEILPELSTNLMPVLGNRLDLAIDQATDLLKQTNARSGQIIVIADDAGLQASASIESAASAHRNGYTVSVLGVGTIEGAELQTANGQLLKSQDGQVMKTALAQSELIDLSNAGGGAYVGLSAGNQDVDSLIQDLGKPAISAERLKDGFQADTWKDMGYWLLLIPLLLAPLAFRKNMLLALPVSVAVLLSAHTPDASAAEWDDLWRTPDQQAAIHFGQGDFGAAASEFESQDWKASALYKEGKYADAANIYANSNADDKPFNLGNSLAKSGEFESAIAAYDEALSQNPEDEDARFNRELVAKLLEQQQQQQEPEQGDDQQEQQQGDGQQDQQQGEGQQEQQQGEGQQDQQQGEGQQEQQQGDGQQEQQQGDAQQDQQQGEGQQDQQQGEGQQDQQQGEGQQDQQQGEGQQDQQQGEGQQDQQQGEGQQDQQQGEGQQDQQQGEGQQDQQQGEGQQEQQGDVQQEQQQGDGQQDPQQGDGQQEQQRGDEETAANSKSAFSKAMDELLQGNGDDSSRDQNESTETPVESMGFSELDQALEQQLRAVPDDPSGLLRARIRQHYARYRNGR